MTHTTTKQGNRWLHAGLTSLLLGVGALCLTASPAFATQVWVHDDTTTFNIMEQAGPYNGKNDKVYADFDFSGPDWNTVTINGALLELHLTVGNNGINSDEILFGSILNGGGTDLVDTILVGGVDLFDQTTVPGGIQNPNSFNLPVPNVGDELVLNLDLSLFYGYGDLQSKLLGGDSVDNIYMKYSDDALVTYAKLSFGYDEVLDIPDTNCDNCPPTTNSPVPEPSTMILLGSGLMGLVAWRKRQQA